MDRQPTWQDFLDFHFEHHIGLKEQSPTSSSTTPYSAITSPPAGSYLRQSGLNLTIVPRILDSFRTFLEEKGILHQLLPVGIVYSLERFQRCLSRTTISIEASVGFILSSMFPIIEAAVEALTDQTFTVTQHAPLQQYTQQGGRDWKTVTIATGTPVKSTGIEAKEPRVLFHHATDMQKEYEYEPLIAQYNAKAMCSKAWLQLSTCNPASEYGIVFSGLSAVVVERGLYALNHHALHVSPHYHVFRDDNPPTTAEYDFINEHNHCEKGIPLLAIMTFILLPNASVRKDVHPAIRNPVTVSQQDKTIQEKRAPTETRTTGDETSAGVSEAVTKASMVSLIFEHPDVAQLPRLLYPQMLHDSTPHDIPPLSPSRIRSTGFDTELPPSPSQPPPLVGVQLFERITIGNFAQVWRGSLTDSQGTVTSVVAKMYSQRYFEAMNKETRAYRLLSRHELDNLAPVYYGTFTMADESWGAVILSDVGEAFHYYSWDEAGMNSEELRTIWKYVNALHSIGLHHHDLEPWNIAKDRNGTLRILDFERSLLDNSCPCGELEGLGQLFDSMMEWR
ncbi:uncharacterized protein EV420DRAFT_1638995 [Desarmillaria tabescens]|uniref:Protein kinase domain-containing protein n=1 Tax=Armillaria tabescens TaxID=1929756 RepID=A0AA39NC33_ARMTA|nr:uncharacterized protein EV420DRAFT_1638995 [Desarmillaria tabescens]KAK0462903.1 hypothetical protein EV420DRAFT_1638995 [Desarmillaria tabescens]